MKRIFFLVLFFFMCNAISAQEFSVTGRVTNKAKQPVEFVYVSLLKDGTPQQQVATDSLGRFFLKAERGTYRMIVEQFGQEFLDRMIVLDNDVELKELEIEEATQLEGVILTSRKKILEQKVDRLVFNVENSVAATGGTAVDALKATPTVRVQNESIAIIGKGEVLVMIDDRLQRIPSEEIVNFLKSIPSDNIKSIEVITTPPARFAAEGNSGLINIRLKKAKADSWNANIGASYIQKTYAGDNLQGLFNYNQDKLSLHVSIARNKQKVLSTSISQIFYPQELWSEEVRNKSETDQLSAGFGVDYKLTKSWTTGVKYLGAFTDKASQNNPFTAISDVADNTINSFVASAVEASNAPRVNSLNLYQSFALDTLGKSISVNVDYFNYEKKDNRFFSGNELDANRQVLPSTYFSSTNGNRNKAKNYSGSIDVSLPYKWVNLSFGGRVSYTNTSNDLKVFDLQTGTPVLDPDQTNVFNYKEYNEALYLSAGKKLSDKWEAQIGLRMEATQTEGYSQNLNQTNENNYIQLFPTAYLTYAANESNTFSLNYSRRIRRPDFDYLNPFVIRTSPYFYSEGNPFLRPSYINNLEFSYISNQNWVSAVYYSRITDFSQELSIVDTATRVTRQTPLNYANTYQIGLSTYYNFKRWTGWNSITGFNFNYQDVRSMTSVVRSIGGYNGYLYTNNDFTLNHSKSVFLGLNYALQLPGRYQIFNISTLNMFDVSMKFLFLDKNLSLTIAGEDLLNAQKPLITYASNDVRNTIRSYNDTRGFRISLSYKFGNSNLQSKQRGFGNEEERSRAN